MPTRTTVAVRAGPTAVNEARRTADISSSSHTVCDGRRRATGVGAQTRWHRGAVTRPCFCAQAYNRDVTLTRLVTKFTYRIEPNAGGGFIAHASDPNVSPLEGATREELQAKIRARIASDLATEFPGLKVPLDRPGHKFEFHVEVKPSGGFTLHSADPNALPIDGATHDDLQSHVVEKLIGNAGQREERELALGEPRVA